MLLTCALFLCFLTLCSTEEDDPRKCPVSMSGCIYDDEVEGTDCTAGGNDVCLSIGADYCSAVTGEPPKRVCCSITGTFKVRANPDVRGCPPSTQGCIFDDIVHGADCTVHGNADCFAAGGDYCSAWFGYPERRVCCTIADSQPEILTAVDAHGCPDSMSGCMFDDYINGADCTVNGNQDCMDAGSDYCSGWVRDQDGQSRRLCCDISGEKPFGASKADGSRACPMSMSGCIYDDIVGDADCTELGNGACKAAGSDYCSAFFGDPPRRVCCDISRDDSTQKALEHYEKTCPVSKKGCIYDDEIDGTDCTHGGNPTCRAVGADYCSAVFGTPPQRVCCRISGVSKFQQSSPDIRGCPPSNFGCVFDDNVHGADCSINGNLDCFNAGSDYCSAWFGHPPRRVCCDIARDTRENIYHGTFEETCPHSTMGCIFDDHVHGADCTERGNIDCIGNGSDYCSAWIGEPERRFCCSIAGPGPAPASGDGARACPVSNSGCMYDDYVDGTDCTHDGNEVCIAAGASYCSAFIGTPPRRVCCSISGLETEDLTMYLVIVTVGGFCMILLLLIMFCIWYRIEKKRQAAALWHIRQYELRKYEERTGGTGSHTSLTSASSAGSMASSITTMTKQARINLTYELYNFKGNMVGVKKHHAGMALKNADLLELMKMREITHDNVNPFLGLCTDSLQILSVWKLCPKGSILDLFEMENLKLDWVFKYSLMRDLTEGLDYIGRSALKKHGNLTSKCCLMDSRWQLKISDYGLTNMRKSEKVATKDQVWRAPEILRDPSLPVGIEQDIYSMAIIISEIVSRAQAWTAKSEQATEDGKITKAELRSILLAEIVYRVRKGEVPSYRPMDTLPRGSDVNPTAVQLMKDCWEEKPENRPNLRTIRHTVKGMMRGKSTNLMDHVMHMMEEYAGTLEAEVSERTRELAEEKKKADLMLYRMLPKSVVDKMKSGQAVEPESYEQVTIFCSDIVGFTALTGRGSANQIVVMLNDMYNVCDSIVDQFDIYKVETTTDGYLCASGLPTRNGKDHAEQIAELALTFRKSIMNFRIPHLPREKMKVRIGIHSGPVIAGVVGMSMPRYCLFGDTVITAVRMEESGKPNQIHIAESTNKLLTEDFTGYVTRPRGEIMLKDVGVCNTFWLVGHEGEHNISLDNE